MTARGTAVVAVTEWMLTESKYLIETTNLVMGVG